EARQGSPFRRERRPRRSLTASKEERPMSTTKIAFAALAAAAAIAGPTASALASPSPGMDQSWRGYVAGKAENANRNPQANARKAKTKDERPRVVADRGRH